MALQSLPWAIQGSTHPAEVARNLTASIFGAPVAAFTNAVGATSAGGAHGVVGSGDLLVAQNGTPNMSVNIAAGRALVRAGNASSILAGAWPVLNDATVNVAIAASDPTNPRIDLVCVQVRDTNYGEAASDDRFFVVTGTPGAVPAVPSLAATPNALVLAQVAVAAVSTTVLNAAITDKRTFATALGGIQRALSAQMPSGASLYNGLGIWNPDTFKFLINTTATTGAVPPWNLPWGILSSTVVSVDQTGIVAEVDLTSFTATITAVANRLYKATWLLGATQVTTGGATQIFKISVDGVTSIVNTQLPIAAAAINMMAGSFIITGLAAGARVIKLRASTSAGTLTIPSNSNVNGRWIIEDIGPAANPA